MKLEASTSRVIGTAALIAVGVGTLNSFAKYKRPPSVRFLIGSGAAFVILSAIGEAEPEVAKALAIAVATTVVIGEGGGVLTYLSEGEIDTRKKRPNSADGGPLDPSDALYPSGENVNSFTPDEPQTPVWSGSTAAIHAHPFVLDLITPIPGVR